MWAACRWANWSAIQNRTNLWVDRFSFWVDPFSFQTASACEVAFGPGFPGGGTSSGCSSSLDPPDKRPLGISGKFMFPNTQHPPARTSQFLRYRMVTGFIARQFFLPIRPVALRTVAVLRAAVPEAAVHEKDEA